MNGHRDNGENSALAELAAEYWKLLRNYDHVVAAAPENLKAGLAAQANYATRRLISILGKSGLHIETFEEQVYLPNLPITALNAEDFSEGEPALVEQTLEPAIISGTTPIRFGRVYLRPAPRKEE